MLIQSIARIMVKHLGNAVGFGVAGDAALDIWKVWNEYRQDQRQKLEEVQKLAAQPADEARRAALEATAEVAGDQPETVKQALTAYLTQVPNAIRASQRRSQDLSGRTVSSQLRLTRPEDLLVLLPPMPRFKPGDRPAGLGDWELEELLGTGGFGEVWKAKNPHMPHAERVALKFCLDPAAAKVLRHEAAVLDQVMREGKHPGIVQLRHTYFSADVPCLEYEFVSGGDLTSLVFRQLKRNQGKLPVQMVTGIMRNIIRGVRYAHRLTPPIVHRDLKPANILVQPRPDGKVELRVADFGIGGIAAKCAIDQTQPDEAPGLFLTTGTRGSCTPIYCSPQQARGEDPDPRDDVHALGVIWYQLLVGDLTIPAPAEWHAELADRQVPEVIILLLGSCLSTTAERRPADAAVLAEEIDKLVSPPPPPPPPPPPEDPFIIAAKVLEEDPRWEVVAHPSKGLGFVPKEWLEWLPPLALRGDPRAWIYAFLAGKVDRLLFSVEMTPMDDPAKRIEIATKLLDECPGLGFKRPKSWHGVKNNYSRVSAVETILQWSEGGEPKSDAIRVAVKKMLDDLYPKLEKLALVLKPLCQLPTSATARAVPTDRANWEKRATPEMLQLTDQLLKLVNEVDPKAELRYAKNVIGIQADGLPLYFVHFSPQKGCVHLQIKTPQSEEADKLLEGTGLDVRSRGRDYRLRISGPVNDKQRGILLDLIRQAAKDDAE